MGIPLLARPPPLVILAVDLEETAVVALASPTAPLPLLPALAVVVAALEVTRVPLSAPLALPLSTLVPLRETLVPLLLLASARPRVAVLARFLTLAGRGVDLEEAVAPSVAAEVTISLTVPTARALVVAVPTVTVVAADTLGAETAPLAPLAAV